MKKKENIDYIIELRFSSDQEKYLLGEIYSDDTKDGPEGCD